MGGNGRTNAARRPGRGFILVTMLVSLTILLVFLGLAIDVGYEQYMKIRMQAAADAAALGGARELAASGSANLIAAARGDSASNGFTNGQNSVTVTINNPPSTGYSTGNGTAVEAIISQPVPTFFMQVLGFSSGTVRARAVAQTEGGGADRRRWRERLFLHARPHHEQCVQREQRRQRLVFLRNHRRFQ